MKFLSAIFATVMLLVLKEHGHAQGFVNLGFESAHFIPIPGDPYNRVQFVQAFPGWTGTVAGIPLTGALSNEVFLDTAGIAIIDRNWTNSAAYTLGFLSGTLIQGNYTAILMSGSLTNNVNGVDTSLSQTSLVPIGMQSLFFKAYTVFDSSGAFAVTLGGQTLPLSVQGVGTNYTLYGADIGAFAGLTNTLSFTVFGENPHVNDEYLFLDSIQFSPQSIPEPNTLALGAFGALFFGFRRWRNSSR